MKNFIEFCTKIQNTSKRTEKEAILQQYKEDEIVTSILKFLFNKYIITGISKEKLKRVVSSDILKNLGNSNYNSILDMLEYLKENNTGRDCDLLVVEKFAMMYSEWADWVYKIASKDITLGIQATTLNKIYGKDFVPTFDVMLAQKYFDDPDKLVPEGSEFILTTKLDGVRCVCIKDHGKISFFSRQGQPIFDLVDIETEAKDLPDNFVYDGELLLDNKDNLPSKDLYRATVKITSSDNIKKNIVFNVFDLIDLDAFKEGYEPKPAYMRKSMLNKIFARRSFSWIKEVEILYEGSDKSKIKDWLDKITDAGGEGVMINLSDAPYECKRTKGLLKVKKMQSADLRCIDLEIGSGINSDRLGAAIVELPGEDGKTYQVKVGSGFTFEDREL